MTSEERLTYIRAAALRTKAETTCNPELYEQAAADFDALGMTAAAERCRVRAKHYQEAVGDVMIYLPENKIAFRCSCGANVFKKINNSPLKYKCNGCGDLYLGEA